MVRRELCLAQELLVWGRSLCHGTFPFPAYPAKVIVLSVLWSRRTLFTSSDMLSVYTIVPTNRCCHVMGFIRNRLKDTMK